MAPGSPSCDQTVIAAPAILPVPAFVPTHAPVSATLTLTRDDHLDVSTARPDSSVALVNVTLPQNVSLNAPIVSDTTVALDASAKPLTSIQTPAVVLKKPGRPRRVGPKIVSAPKDPQSSAAARPTCKTTTNTTTKKATAPKKTTAITKKVAASKKECPGR